MSPAVARARIVPCLLAVLAGAAACSSGGGTVSGSAAPSSAPAAATPTAGGTAAPTSAAVAPTSSAPSSEAAPTSSAPSSVAAPATSAAGGATAGNAYYPVAVGNTWKYTITYSSGAIGTVDETNKITALTPVSGGTDAAILIAFHYRSGGLKDSSDTVHYVFHPDGSITLPFNSVNGASGTSIKVLSGGGIQWPAPDALAAGKTSAGTIKAQLLAGGTTGNVSADVKVSYGGAKSVTVPAGSYATRIVRQSIAEHISVSGSDTPVTVVADAYLAKGVGPVQIVTTGLIDATAVLVSFTPGA